MQEERSATVLPQGLHEHTVRPNLVAAMDDAEITVDDDDDDDDDVDGQISAHFRARVRPDACTYGQSGRQQLPPYRQPFNL